MFDLQFGTELVESVCACRRSFPGGAEAVGEFLAVVGEDRLDAEGRCPGGATNRSRRPVSSPVWLSRPRAACRRGAGQVGVDEFLGHSQQVIQVEPRGFPVHQHHCFLGRGQGR